MLKEQAAMGLPAPSYLAYDAAHAKERMQDYWVCLLYTSPSPRD